MNTRSVIIRPITRTLLVAAGILALAGCGDDSSSDSSGSDAGIAVSSAWARTSPADAAMGAAYLTIDNSGGTDDALVSAKVAPSVAARAELHQTTAATGSSASMTTESGMAAATTTVGGMNGSTPAGGGMMEMKPVDRIPVPAGGSVALEPGGYHVMLFELVKPLEVGSTVELTLTFEKSGDKVVSADVRDTAP